MYWYQYVLKSGCHWFSLYLSWNLSSLSTNLTGAITSFSSSLFVDAAVSIALTIFFSIVVNFCCYWYWYQYDWNWIITGPLSQSPSFSFVSSNLTSIQRSLFYLILFIVCWCGNLYCLDNILFHIHQLLLLLVWILIYSKSNYHWSFVSISTSSFIKVQQQHKPFFVHCLFGWRYLLPQQHPFPCLEVNFCCCIGTNINMFEIRLSQFICFCLHLLLYQQIWQQHLSLNFLIVGWCGGLYRLYNILYHR